MFQVLLSNTNNSHIVIWFKYFYLLIIISKKIYLIQERDSNRNYPSWQSEIGINGHEGVIRQALWVDSHYWIHCCVIAITSYMNIICLCVCVCVWSANQMNYKYFYDKPKLILIKSWIFHNKLLYCDDDYHHHHHDHHHVVPLARISLTLSRHFS